MQNYLDKIEELIENIKGYTVKTFELFMLEAADRYSVIVSGFISKVVIWIVVLLFVFFLSLGISFYLSELLGSSYLGFGIVAGFYLLLGIILIIGRRRILANPIRDRIIQEMLQSKKTR